MTLDMGVEPKEGGTVAEAPSEVVDPVDNLGSRLRDARMRSGLSLRAVARRLEVSPSFISQMENGKSQPSVATLYAVAQLLDVSIDELFAQSPASPANEAAPTALDNTARRREVGETNPKTARGRSGLTTEAEGWKGIGSVDPFQLTSAPDRPRLVMDSGVVWEQLAASHDRNIDFMEIVYPPGSSSTTDGHMLRHAGREYGYLLSGELQITFGFDTYLMGPGDSIRLDSTVPHLFTNLGTVPARGIWAVHHCAPAEDQDN